LLADHRAMHAMADAARSAGIPDAGGLVADCVERIMRARRGRRRTCSRMGLLA